MSPTLAAVASDIVRATGWPDHEAQRWVLAHAVRDPRHADLDTLVNPRFADTLVRTAEREHDRTERERQS